MIGIMWQQLLASSDIEEFYFSFVKIIVSGAATPILDKENVQIPYFIYCKIIYEGNK